MGFGANYSLFHSVENTIHDHRIDDLIDLLEFVFDLYSRLQKAAAAAGAGDLQADLSDSMSDLAGWWDQYGSTNVSGLESFSGHDAWESAAKVSTSLAAWHNAGTAAGDVAFWNRHVDRFTSTKAYVLLAEALLDQCDPVASMALMMHWLSHSETIPLAEGDFSFHTIAIRWIEQLWTLPNKNAPAGNEEKSSGSAKNSSASSAESRKMYPDMSLEQRWNLTRKFFDFLEANADHYWNVPALELSDDMFEEDAAGSKKKKKRKRGKPDLFEDELNSWNENTDEFDEENYDDEDYADKRKPGSYKDRDADEGESIYSAAYENVTYHDTTDDGIDDSMMDAPTPGFNDGDDLELANETERISDRLTFIVTLSKLWKYVTERLAGQPELTEAEERKTELVDTLDAWLAQIVRFGKGLDVLLRKAATYQVPPPRGTADSLLEYDRHRGTKEILLDRIAWTHVDVLDAKMILESFLGKEHWRDVTDDWEKAVLEVNHLVFQGKVAMVRKRWSAMLRMLSHETILYVPSSRGGKPWVIVRCRRIQQAIMRLMEYRDEFHQPRGNYRVRQTGGNRDASHHEKRFHVLEKMAFPQ